MNYFQRFVGVLFLTVCVIALTLSTTWFAVQYEMKRWMEKPLDFSILATPKEIAVQSTSEPKMKLQSKDQQASAVSAIVGDVPINHNEQHFIQETNTPSVSANNPVTEEKLVISAEQFATRKDGLTNQERLRIYELFTKHLPETELKKVTRMLDGGLTEKEIEQLSALLEKHFPPSERREIESIWLRWQPLPSETPNPE